MVRKKQRHDMPKQTNMLVPILPEAATRAVVEAYRLRWSVERLVEELQGETGLGPYHVTKEPHRVERSIALAMLVYLMLLKCRAQDIPENDRWSASTVKRNVT